MLYQSSLLDLPVEFISFGSGSSGNCYYLRHGDCGIIIDLGVGVRRFSKSFTNYGFNFGQIKAAFITHDHLDHVRASGPISRKYSMPVYATELVHQGMRRNPYNRQKVNPELARIIEHGTAVEVGPFTVMPFHVPHDASDNTGYFITCRDITFCLITDAGTVTEEMRQYIRQAQYLVIETNYDPDMLASGRYPVRLQNRIRSGRGHLSNFQCAEVLRECIDPQHLDGLWLCHLSQENNTPTHAYETVSQTLRDLQLSCLPIPLRRVEPTGPFTLTSKSQQV